MNTYYNLMTYALVIKFKIKNIRFMLQCTFILAHYENITTTTLLVIKTK